MASPHRLSGGKGQGTRGEDLAGRGEEEVQGQEEVQVQHHGQGSVFQLGDIPNGEDQYAEDEDIVNGRDEELAEGETEEEEPEEEEPVCEEETENTGELVSDEEKEEDEQEEEDMRRRPEKISALSVSGEKILGHR